MKLFDRTPKAEPLPDWRLSISPGIATHNERIIDGIRVTFDKTCWTWTLIREDLRGQGAGWLWDMGSADTEDEALELGMEQVKRAQSKHSAMTKLSVQ
jgi:hypothetical protein